jgi:ABC-type amino acid transport substrate-binding protein
MIKRTTTIILALLAAAALAGCAAAPAVAVQGDIRVALSTDPAPPLAGRDTAVDLAISEAGAPLAGATVALRRSMAGMEHPSDQELVPAEDLGGGRYRATLSFSMGGRWDVAAVIERPGGGSTLVVPLDVEQP